MRVSCQSRLPNSSGEFRGAAEITARNAGTPSSSNGASRCGTVSLKRKRVPIGSGFFVSPDGLVPTAAQCALFLESRRLLDRATRWVLTARGARVLVPLTLASFDLDWADAADPERTALGVAALADARLILAPALSVDAAGTRLGQAGGCYDRALPRAAASAVIVAVLHPGEFVGGRLPADSWDHPVDAVVSAAGVAWTAYGMVRHAALPD